MAISVRCLRPTPAYTRGRATFSRSGKLRQQVKLLKYETNFFIANIGQVIIGHLANILAVQHIPARRGGIETAKDVHEVLLPEPEGPIRATYSLLWISRSMPFRTCNSCLPPSTLAYTLKMDMPFIEKFKS